MDVNYRICTWIETPVREISKHAYMAVKSSHGREIFMKHTKAMN